jgi:CubicO group peptidase (beta-lactamase class C family)
VEVVAGVPFEEFMQAHVLDPLGMVDTVWHVDAGRTERLAALYSPTPGTKQAFRYDAMGGRATTPPVAPMGGGGLSATAGDYVRFAEMLRARGELDGVRILAPSSVDMMASNHLPGGVDLAAIGRPLFAETTFDGVGFGLGVSVTIDPVKAKVPGSVGDFGWGGAASTFYWVDPVRDLTVVFMTQLLPSSTHPIRSQLKQLVHASLVHPDA